MERLFCKICIICCMMFVFVSCSDNDDAAVSLTFDKSEMTVRQGQTGKIAATLTVPLEDGKSIEWTSSNEAVASVDEGTVLGVSPGEAIITASYKGMIATCAVTVTSVELTLDKTELAMEVGSKVTLIATVTPPLGEGETLAWSSSDEAVATVADGVVSAVGAGEATITVACGTLTAICQVTVTLSAPKVGDYFYSDGTWSDGGLVSMDIDGQNAVWADVKPDPVSGKTVIGIVCQTNPDRIADTEKTNGFTHGYVLATRIAGDDPVNNPTMHWSNDYDFSCLKGAKLASTWYSNVNGYSETMTVKEFYGNDLATWMPAFDAVLNKFPVAAPANTSGWFLPSTGQLWDALANLCGSEAAKLFKDWQTYSYDATHYCTDNVSYDAIAYFNSMMAKVPAADKNDMVETTSTTWDHFCSIWVSTPYDSEAACQFNIGSDGLIECMCDWYDGDAEVRPILAF